MWCVVHLPGAFAVIYLFSALGTACLLSPISFQRSASLWIVFGLLVYLFHRKLIIALNQALRRRHSIGDTSSFEHKLDTYGRENSRWELCVVVIATLQGGYGDLFSIQMANTGKCEGIVNANP
jgi:hypothetical protein